MFKLKVMLVAVMFVMISSAAFADGVIVNQDFNSGIDGWTTWYIQNGAPAPVINADGGTLNWAQLSGTKDGNAAGASKVLGSFDVSGYSSLVLRFDLNLAYQDPELPAPGAGGEIPAIFGIAYNDGSAYNHGFYLTGTDTGSFGAQQIGTGWNTYTFDLKTLINPSKINAIGFYGSGWNYQASVDNVYLGSVNAVPEPISTALFLLGGATMAVRRLRRK